MGKQAPGGKVKSVGKGGEGEGGGSVVVNKKEGMEGPQKILRGGLGKLIGCDNPK